VASISFYFGIAMQWFAVRSLYQFGRKSDGTNIFEERIVGFQAETPSEAFVKAQRESAAYAADHNFVVHPEQELYEQDGDPLIDGYELWSLLFQSAMTLDEFYEAKYRRYEYRPE
jgi:hypothetical protein